MPRRLLVLLALGLVLLVSLTPLRAADPLPSWNDTPLKVSLVKFVGQVTAEGTADFVPVAERIAVLDNDGTLCAEQPMYFQTAFGVARVKEQAAAHPEWREKQPFKAALEDDLPTLGKSGVDGLNELVAGTHAGRTIEELEKSMADWLATARHPTLHRPYTELVYQPMLELMRYLRANGFKTYVVTGSDAEFLRVWAESAYGVPREQILGSSLQAGIARQDPAASILVADGVAFANNKENKAIGIQRTLGRRPIFAIGNSDGDLDMLRYTAGSPHLHWTGLVHHTDAVREFAYDTQSFFGTLNLGLADAKKNGWWIVDMKNDWGTIFPVPAKP